MIRESALTEKQTYWFNHIRQCEEQKLAAPAYCSEHQLKPSQFYSYKHNLKRKGVVATNQSKPAFARAQAASPRPQHPQTALTLSVVWRSFRLQLSKGSHA